MSGVIPTAGGVAGTVDSQSQLGRSGQAQKRSLSPSALSAPHPAHATTAPHHRLQHPPLHHGRPHATQPRVAASSSSVKVSPINVGDERLHLSLLALLGCVLQQLVSFEEASYPQGRGPISMFHTAYVPSISISSYLRRIALYCKVSTEVVIQSVLHVHQLMQRAHQPLVVNSLNIHRLLLTSVMSTAKYFDDAHYGNSYYSVVGGVPLKELNSLEVEFLSLLNFDFYVNSSTYAYFYSMVIEPSIHQQGCSCASLLPYMPPSLPIDDALPICPGLDCQNLFPPLVCESSLESMTDEEPRSGLSFSSAMSSDLSDYPSRSGCGSTTALEDSPSPPTLRQGVGRVARAVATHSSHSSHSAMDDVDADLSSIRLEADTPVAMSSSPDHAMPANKQQARTPRQYQHAAQFHQQPYRSASPVSFLSGSGSLSYSSSVGLGHSSPSVSTSFSSSSVAYSSATRPYAAAGGGSLSRAPHHHSPSISTYAQRYQPSNEEDYLCDGSVTPKQHREQSYLHAHRDPSLTPLAKSHVDLVATTGLPLTPTYGAIPQLHQQQHAAHAKDRTLPMHYTQSHAIRR